MSPAQSLPLTASLVAAYVANNSLPAADLPGFIASTHAAVNSLGQPVQAEPEAPVPAVAINRSVNRNAVTCLECGKAFKSLKRHIGAEHGLDPAGYRAKWVLPKTYPMVAPAYAEQRSNLAKSLGLGRNSQNQQRAA